MSFRDVRDWTGHSADPHDEQFGDIIEQATLETADEYDAMLVGEPYDGAVIGRAGAREGPEAIRDALARTKTHHFDAGPVDSVADLGDIEIPDGESVSAVQHAVREVAESIHETDAIPVFLGGDNSLTYANVAPLLGHRADGGYVTDGGFGNDEDSVGDVEHFDPTGGSREDDEEDDADEAVEDDDEAGEDEAANGDEADEGEDEQEPEDTDKSEKPADGDEAAAVPDEDTDEAMGDSDEQAAEEEDTEEIDIAEETDDETVAGAEEDDVQDAVEEAEDEDTASEAEADDEGEAEDNDDAAGEAEDDSATDETADEESDAAEDEESDAAEDEEVADDEAAEDDEAVDEEESGVGTAETVETVSATSETESTAERVGVISLDAHLDIREVEGQPTSGTPYRQLLDAGLDSLAVLGARHFETTTTYAEEFRERGGEIITAEEVGDDPIDAAGRALETVADADVVYVSVDMDVLDTTAGPGVSAPTPGGITSRELFRIVRLLASDDRLAGVEIVETAPPLCPDGRTARAAARTVAHALSVQ